MNLFSQLLLSLLLVGAVSLSVSLAPEGTPPFPEGEPFTGDDLQRLHEIRDNVSKLRGIQLDNDIDESLLSRDDLRAYYDDAIKGASIQEQRERDAWTLAYRLLRMLGPDDTIEGVSASSTGELAIGFYVPDEKRLLIVGDLEAGSLSEESTIAHEYVHALQDSRFHLTDHRSFGWDDEDAEYSTTASCVAEGDASIAQYLYLAEVYGPDWYSLYVSEISDTADDAFEAAAVPDAMLRYFYFNYNECSTFLFDIWSAGGWPAVDHLYDELPATTEQVLHPQKYRAGEAPLHVEANDVTRALGVGWRPLERLVFGEFDVYNYLLTANLSTSAAAQAAEGWGGGRISVYTRGLEPDQDVLLHVALVWDTAADYHQFQTALNSGIDRLGYDTREEDGGVWTWSSPGEYGRAIWDDDAGRVDLLYSTDEPALQRVAGEFD